MRYLVCIAPEPVVLRREKTETHVATEVDKPLGRRFEILEGVGRPTPFKLQDRYINYETAEAMIVDPRYKGDWQIVGVAEIAELERMVRL